MADSTRTADVIDQLAAGISQLTTSEAWTKWLHVAAQFHSYSFANTVLILQQSSGQATRVAGFHAWRKLGRHVRKGERALWIFAPMTRRVASDDDDDSTRVLTGFKVVPVFDTASTDGEPLPEIASRLHGDDPAGAYDRLVDVARAIGYSVEDASLPGETNGDCNFSAKRIRVRVDNAPAQRLKTLCHELAHAMLHEDFHDRALAELEAESVAWIVIASIGINSDGYSFGYLASWGGGGEEAVAAIRLAGNRIQQTANLIVTKLEDLQAPVAAAA